MEENTQSPAVSMRSAAMSYGLYAAIISIAIFIGSSAMGYDPFDGGMNYLRIVTSIVLLVLAQMRFKKGGDGFMSFGQGVGVGLWFTLVSSAIALIVMYIYINFVDYAPMQLMLDEQLAKMQAGGSPDNAIEMAQTWTKKLFWVFAVLGRIGGGIIIVLIVTIFTQKKAFV